MGTDFEEISLVFLGGPMALAQHRHLHIYISTLALALCMAQVGCGSHSNKGVSTGRGSVAGSAKRGATGGLGGVADPNAKVTAAQITQIRKSEADLQTGTAVLKTELPDGNYQLQAIASTFYYNHSPEDLIAIHASAAVSDGKTVPLIDPSNFKTAGTMNKYGDVGQTVELPLAFAKSAANGFPPRNQAANMHIFNIMKSATTAKALTYTLSDTFESGTTEIQASVLGILAADNPTVTDKQYKVTVDGVPVSVKLLKVNDQTLQVWVSFAEKTPAKTGTIASGTNDETLARDFYFTYKIIPDPTAPVTPPAAPPAGTPPAANAPTEPTQTPSTGQLPPTGPLGAGGPPPASAPAPEQPPAQQ
jgi:hypothetical protein